MKKFLLIGLAILLSSLTFNNSFAQKANLNIAVISVDEVLKSSTAMKKIQEDMTDKETKYQTQIDKKYETLDQEAKKIESKKSILSAEAYKKEKENFVKKFENLKIELEDKRKSLKKGQIEALTQVDKKVKEIIDEISKEKNIDLILPASQLIYHNEELNISAEVLDRLNKELKEVKVNFN